MNIKEKFISLTSQTYPHGTEHQLFDKLPQNLEMDEFGNLFIKIGESDVMFTSHLDTATSALSQVKHVFDGNIIKTDGTSILGADDKAGVTIMLNMIENNIPGLYYFFLGEEVGCVGSKKVAQKHKTEKLPYINKVISFDRRGTNSVITFQSSSRCCSENFANELATQLNLAEETFTYKTDPTGIYTDSAQFVSIYPECTNISVGYYSEHTYSERQDIEHLEKLAKACLKVDWNNLPVERDPSKVEYSSSRSGNGYGWGAWEDYSYEYKTYDAKPKVDTQKVTFYDEEYQYLSDITIQTSTGDIQNITLSPDRIQKERQLISNFLDDIELQYSTFIWNGLKLSVYYKDGRVTDATRLELEEYIDDLDLTDVIGEEDINETKFRPSERDWSDLEYWY